MNVQSPNAISSRPTAKTRILRLILLAGIVSLGVHANATTRNVPTTYPTIQAAVNASAPGDEIVMAAGTYIENITIDKRVTLKGAGAATIIQSAVANTPVIRVIAGGDNSTDRLVFQDLTVKGASGSASHAGSGITLEPGVLGYVTFDNVSAVENSGTGVDINLFDLLTDIVIKDSNLSQNGGAGFRAPASSLGINGLDISGSHFDKNVEGGFTAYSATLTNWHIRNSTFNDNVGADQDYVGGYGMYLEGHVVQDISIDCSEFNRNIGNAANGANYSAGLIFFPFTPGASYSNINIQHSQFNDNPGAGVWVQPDTGTLMNNIAFECDAFERNSYGVLLFDGGLISGFSIHHSNFISNVVAGIYNLSSLTAIDASLNWWNAANGPGGDAAGSGDAVYGNVNYFPFRTTASACPSACVAAPSITIVKKTNGTDNDSAPGVYVAVPSTVNWTYEVTNNGNVPLTNVTVTDDQGVTVTCPTNALADGESMICTASAPAVAGQYTNIGSVTGTPPTGPNVTASNPDNYFGQTPAITIVKKTNGTDNDVAPGPTVAVGSTVNWTYLVKNTGNVALTNVVVTDDHSVAVSCPATTLAVGASMTCTASGSAVAGQYTNVGTATGTPPVGDNVTASNPDHYFGSNPSITLVKKTNGTDNNVAPGPIVPVGSTVTWTYLVTNTGNVTLTNVTVTDNKVGAICTVPSLAAGASTTCSKNGTALAGQYTNLGTVVGTPPVGPNVSATDPDNYFGSSPSITLIKKTNGTDNNVAPGPTVTVGSTVTWTYLVTNTGNVTLNPVTVTDDKIGAITCPQTSLAPGASMTCTASGAALAGQYTNLGTATGKPPVGGNVTATNPDNYFGQAACVASSFNFTGGTSATTGTAGNIRTFTAGGVSVHVSAFGETKPTTGTHVFSPAYLGHYSPGLGVTDSSENGASNTHIVDNSGQNNYVMFEFSQSVGVDRAYLDYIVGDSDITVWIGTIPNAYTTHQNLNAALLTSLGFTEVNLGSNVARWADINAGLLSGNVLVIAAKKDETDDGFKLSKLETACPGPGITIVKKTNGTDNNVAPGPTVAVGSTVTWTYLVTNTGNVTLNPVTVTDDKVGAISCPATTLAAGASMTCTKTGTAVGGQYTNVGTVTGKPPTGSNVTASNPDNYFGSVPGISIVKKTNGTNNDVAPGPTVNVGSTVTWTYLVTNTGNVPLTGVAVTDNKIGAISCPATTLAVGGSMTCTKTGTAVAGQYTNIGTVTGNPPVGSSVTASNPDNYFGLAPCPATGTISFAGSTATSGTAGNIKTFSVGSVNVHASAFSRIRSGGTWNTAYLGSYSGGLGVTDGSEGTGANDTHKIDNIGGRDNYVLLEFSTPVVIDKAFLDVVGADSDASIWIGTKTNPYTTHITLSDATLTGFYMEENSTADVTPGSRWADLNVSQKSGNVVVIAALASDSSPEDAFKLSKLELACPPPPTCAAATFNFNGNTATSGTAGNIRTFAVNGLTVNVSAFSRADSGGAWTTSYLGLYSGGLGVTDSSEGTGANNTHKVDNGGGRNNYVLFEFSAPVVIDQAYLDIIGADSDISTWLGTAPDPINNHLTLSDAILGYGIREDNLGGNTARWANFNAGNVPANALVISGLMGDTAYNDAFKISKLDVKCY